MQLNDGPLLRCETAWLQQDPLGDAELADIVQKRRKDEGFAPLSCEVHAVRHRQDLVGHLVRVREQLLLRPLPQLL